MNQADVFIFFDNVQYKKRHFENRNKIRTSSKNSYAYLTVPVISKGRFFQQIKNVEIDHSQDWVHKYLKTIQYSYGKAKYFSEYYGEVEALFREPEKLLVDLNIKIIKKLAKLFGIKLQFLRASHIANDGKGSELILNILRKINATRYFSGKHGGLDQELLARNGIEVIFQNFCHPRYSQLFEPFVESMSSIDLLFNYGRRSIEILEASNAKL